MAATCKKRKMSSMKPLGKYEPVAPAAKDKDFVEVDFNINISKGSDADLTQYDGTKPGKTFLGWGMGLKFRDCASLNQEDVCTQFSEGFDTLIDVPRVLDVEVVEEVIPKSGKISLQVDDWVLKDEGKLYDSNTQMAVPLQPPPASSGFVPDVNSRGEMSGILDASTVQNPTHYISNMGETLDFNDPDESNNKFRKTYVRGTPVYSEKFKLKYGKDYALFLTTKKNMQRIELAINQRSYNSAEMSYARWKQICLEYNPIWSQYKMWEVDGFQTTSGSQQRSQQPHGVAVTKPGTTQPAYFIDSPSKIEIGHYNSFEYNINDYLATDIPNDYFADGVCFAMITSLRSVEDVRYFDDYHLKFRIYFTKDKVKYGSLYLNSLKPIRDLRSLMKNIDFHEWAAETGQKPGTSYVDKKKDTVKVWSRGDVDVFGLDLYNLEPKMDLSTGANISMAGMEGQVNTGTEFDEGNKVPEDEGDV